MSEVQKAIKNHLIQQMVEEGRKKVRISAFIDEDDKIRLDYISKQLEMGMSELIRTIISNGLKDAEKAMELSYFELDEKGEAKLDKEGRAVATEYGKALFGTYSKGE